MINSSEKLNLLSPREKEVVALIASGLCRKETAEKLGISLKTVEGHFLNIYSKLGLNNPVQVARLVWEVENESKGVRRMWGMELKRKC